ncbi:MAG: hypothetical protein FJ077_07555 [Cyanobacteria bacterium K_DeepCast_35m_m2_023]|nr:hypothetical protein [Cyanobacteria bacterium K_DeepCast_35m_m2_023]
MPEHRPIPGQGRPVSLLHHLAVVLSLPQQARLASGVNARRQRQRLALTQRLLDPLPQGLRASGDGERFWRLLRWGGAGMVLAWLLQR